MARCPRARPSGSFPRRAESACAAQGVGGGVTLEALAFRVDAGTVSGTGHAMRCLALAEAWEDRGNEAIFLMADSLSPFDDRLEKERKRAVKGAFPPREG